MLVGFAGTDTTPPAPVSGPTKGLGVVGWSAVIAGVFVVLAVYNTKKR